MSYQTGHVQKLLTLVTEDVLESNETQELWIRCEAARNEAKSLGKSDDEAHNSALTLWNDWAGKMLGDLSDIGLGHLSNVAVGPRWLELANGLRLTREAAGDSETENIANRVIQSYRQWQIRALADFSGYVFSQNVKFDCFVFPAGANFENCKFVDFASFQKANFMEDVYFTGSVFSDGAFFCKVTFSGNADFSGVLFHGETEFGLGTP